MSMLRVCLEYAYSMPTVWLEYAWSMARVCLEPRVTISLLLMLVLGSTSVWSATIDFDLPNGYYYLGNQAGDNGVPAYDGSDFNENFYMCPAYSATVNEQNYLGGDSEKPLITTYKSFSTTTKTYSWAVWYIEAATGSNEGFFYIKHRDSGKYLVANDNSLPGATRRRVNLGPNTKPDGNDGLFYIQSDDNGTTYYIYPKEKKSGDNKYLTPSNGNKDDLSATKANDWTGGIIGFYTAKNKNSVWHFVSVPCETPVITYDNTNHKVTISGVDGANFYYTLNNSDPSSGSTLYGDPFEVTGNTTIKVIATKSGYADSEIASVRIVLTPTITLAQTEYTYSGSAKEPTVSVKDGETAIATSKYNVTYSNNTNAGIATVNIEDIAGDDLIVYGSANFTINPKAVTITANDALKAYNGIALTESGFTTTALETGDTHTFTVVMTEGSTITNIGTEPNVIATVDGTAVTTGTETAIGNYLVTTANGTLTVNPKAVIITAKDASKAYDGTALTESGFTTTALETGDTHTFTVVMTEGSTITNIGTEPNVIATVDGTAVTTDTETAIGNYLVTTANGTLTINPKPLIITADSDTKVYDGTPLTKNSYTHTELLAGDQIVSVTITGSQTDAGTSDNVPSAAIIKNSTDDDVTANYDITYTNGTLEVTKKTLNVTADAKSKAYGEADPTLTYTAEGLINNDAITGTLSRETGENAGTYAITVGGLTAGDNYAISFTSANLTITKVGLKIMAKNHTITYGDIPVDNGVTYEGFVNGDTESSLGSIDYDFSYTQYDDVGNYTIKPKGLTSSNYDITFVKGKLTVSPKEVGLTWSKITSFPYDGSPHTLTATATDMVNDDVIGVKVTGAQTNAGDHTATASALTGDKAGNYKLPTANTQSFTITPKSLVDGDNLADGYTLNFGEGNIILLTDDEIGSALVLSTDYSVGEDTDPSEGYSIRTVTGKGNYTGSFTVRNASVNFSTDTEQERWSGTFVAEKKNEGDIGFVLPEGFSAFIISGIRGEWAIPEPLNYIPADVPVLLVANHQTQGFVVMEAESEKVTAITPDQKDKNMLEKVTEDTPGYNATTQSASFETKKIYLLYKNEFVFNKAGNLKKGKVYLNPNHTASSPEPAPARLMIAWNHTTGIKDEKWKMEDGSSERWYTLDGRCLMGKPTTKGLYIVNGKKIVIK